MAGPEQERLMARLFDDPARKLLNFHITPGDKPATAEQICGEVNKAMDEVERRRVPKVRTSHHRNKEEAARLQELVDKRHAADLEARNKAQGE